MFSAFASTGLAVCNGREANKRIQPKVLLSFKDVDPFGLGTCMHEPYGVQVSCFALCFGPIEHGVGPFLEKALHVKKL